MKLGRKDALKTVAFSVVLTALIVSILVAGGREPGSKTGAAPRPKSVAAEASVVPEAAAPEPQPALEAAPAVEPLSEPAASKPKATAASKPRPRAAAPSSLPPLMPALQGAGGGGEVKLGPPPGVLWLSGIIQGDPTLAVLRRDASRYLVREGDTIESSYRVIEISSASVTLQRGGSKKVLRVGQY